MPDRQAPIAKFSAGQRAGRGRQQRAYGEVDAASDAWCLACGSSYGLEHSHILTQGRHKLQRANPLNIVLLCGRLCHPMWEHNKAKFKATYPAAFAEKMRRMKLIDCQAYAFFKMKHESLFK